MHYIKNVNNQEERMSYMDRQGVFKLHFNYQPHNIKIGENILLLQNLFDVRVLSHLVVIIDENVYESNEYPDYPYYVNVSTIAKATVRIDSLPLFNQIPHGGYALGKLTEVQNMEIMQNERFCNDVKKEVWKSFFKL